MLPNDSPSEPRSPSSAPPYAARLRALVARASAELAGLSDAAASGRPREGAWSAKEILGHLIDSACNNHARFVNARAEPSVPLRGYAQDAWVDTQRYREADWPELIALWSGYNRHLARLMAAFPAQARARTRDWTNLPAIGHAIPDGDPVTLDRLMADYVDHVAHHLSRMPGPGAFSTKE